MTKYECKFECGVINCKFRAIRLFMYMSTPSQLSRDKKVF